MRPRSISPGHGVTVPPWSGFPCTNPARKRRPGLNCGVLIRPVILTLLLPSCWLRVSRESKRDTSFRPLWKKISSRCQKKQRFNAGSIRFPEVLRKPSSNREERSCQGDPGRPHLPEIYRKQEDRMGPVPDPCFPVRVGKIPSHSLTSRSPYPCIESAGWTF